MNKSLIASNTYTPSRNRKLVKPTPEKTAAFVSNTHTSSGYNHEANGSVAVCTEALANGTKKAYKSLEHSTTRASSSRRTIAPSQSLIEEKLSMSNARFKERIVDAASIEIASSGLTIGSSIRPTETSDTFQQ